MTSDGILKSSQKAKIAANAVNLGTANRVRSSVLSNSKSNKKALSKSTYNRNESNGNTAAVGVGETASEIAAVRDAMLKTT